MLQLSCNVTCAQGCLRLNRAQTSDVLPHGAEHRPKPGGFKRGRGDGPLWAVVRAPPGPGSIRAMQVSTGTVVNGKIVLEGVVLAEGAVVTVVTRGADESFSLTPAQEDELDASMAEIERGEFITLEDLLQSLSASN